MITSTVTYKSKILLKNEIIDGFITIDNNSITYVGTKAPSSNYIEINDAIIAPGFIDIHCHTSMKNTAVDNPEEVASFHLSHGTTTMLLTYYRDIPHNRLVECLENLKKVIQTRPNVYGAHLEGPYLNANLGFGVGTNDSPNPNFYREYIKSGVVRQWTCSPEIAGTPEFIKEISDAGIVPAIGHSSANFMQVKKAYDSGARIATHIFDATKAPEPLYDGTLEVDFNEACMLMPDMFCEVICDKNWIHVRKQKFDLLIKTVGIDRIVAITDMFALGSPDDGKDVNFIGLDLNGTKLTMDKIAKNLFESGYNLIDIFKITSYNPARALNLLDRGEIAVGKRADLILIDENAKFIKVL